jgi:hypothetical protein
MAEDIDLKEGEEETPSDTGQSEKETADLSEGSEVEEKPADEKVEISKSELEKLQKDSVEKENYRKAVIRLNKTRGRFLPGSEPESKPKPEKDEFGDDTIPKEEFVTKKELTLRDEKSAISKACEDEEIALNWDDIMLFYVPSEDKYQGIVNAHRRWKADKAIMEKPVEKQNIQDLVADKGLSKGKEKQPPSKKKVIIPHKTTMKEWY